MSESEYPRPVDLGRLAADVGRRWRVVAGTTGLVLLASTGAGLLAPHTYDATASVAVSPIRLSTTSSYGSQDLNIDTERAVMSSREVATAAAAALKGTVSAGTLQGASTVAAPAGSAVLEVTVQAGDPKDAAAWANALAHAYLAFRAQGALQAAKPALAALDERIAAVSPTNTAALTDLKAQQTQLQHVGDATGRLIGQAVPPTAASSAGLPMYLVGGLFGGLLLGILLGFARDLADRRVRFVQRLGRAVGGDALAVDDLTDDESMRRVLRAVTVRAVPAAGRPLVVAVHGAGDVRTDALLAQLHIYGGKAGYGVRVVTREELPAERLERAWRYESKVGDAAELVLVDASHIDSPTRLAVLGDAVDAALVVTEARARLRRVRALAAALGGDRRPVIALLVPSAKRAARRAAPHAEPVVARTVLAAGR